MTITNPYLAKYPFFEDAKEVLDDADMGAALQDAEVLVRATERIVRGVNTGYVSKLDDNPGVFKADQSSDLLVEIQSYPVARMLVSLIGDYRIINRYAQAEAQTARTRLDDEVKQDYAGEKGSSIIGGKKFLTLSEALSEFDIDADPTSLKNELHRTYLSEFFETADEDDIRAFARDVFKLDDADAVLPDETLDHLDPAGIYEVLHAESGTEFDTQWYRLPFVSYVQTAVGMNDTRWRLTNRGIDDGNLIVTREDIFDLFEEAVSQRVGADLPYDVPDDLRDTLCAVEPFADYEESSLPEFWEGFPRSHEEVIHTDSDVAGVADNEYDFIELIRAAIDDDHFSYEIDRVEPGLFPPVIDRLLEGVRNGENLKHEARFTLAAFFINIGMTEDEIVEMLGVGGSFGEEPTRYQVNHIQQGGGSGEPYTPANYATMESWGLDWEKDALEAQVTNPLTYYKIKLKEQDEEGSEDADEGDAEEVEPTEVAPKKMTGADEPSIAEMAQDFADEADGGDDE